MPTIIFLCIFVVMVVTAGWLIWRDRGKSRAAINWRSEVAPLRELITGAPSKGKQNAIMCALCLIGGIVAAAAGETIIAIMAFGAAFYFLAWGHTLLVEEREMRRALAHRSPTNPPLWPPRQPPDWGMEYQVAHRQNARRHARLAMALRAGNGDDGQMPLEPVDIPSWEVFHQAEQLRDPLQIRWAQNDRGEWEQVTWGNRGRPPADAGPLPVYQLMQRVDNGHWIWIKIGVVGMSLDWQNGPAKVEVIQMWSDDGKLLMCRRSIGHPGFAVPPPSPVPDGEHGDSREQSVDDLVRAGIVAPR